MSSKKSLHVSYKITTLKYTLKRENRLRASLEKFITLHKARVVYHRGRGRNKISNQIWLLEIICTSVDASQNQKEKNSFFLASHAPIFHAYF